MGDGGEICHTEKQPKLPATFHLTTSPGSLLGVAFLLFHNASFLFTFANCCILSFSFVIISLSSSKSSFCRYLYFIPGFTVWWLVCQAGVNAKYCTVCSHYIFLYIITIKYYIFLYFFVVSELQLRGSAFSRCWFFRQSLWLF